MKNPNDQKEGVHTPSSSSLPKVALIAYPWPSPAPYKFLSDVINILVPISSRVIVITGNTDRISMHSDTIEVVDVGLSAHYLKDIKPSIYSATLWLVKCVVIQIKTSLQILRARDTIDVLFFYMAYPYYLLPLITSKVLGKRTVEVVTRGGDKRGIPKLLSLQDPLYYTLLDGISLESRTLLQGSGLDKYRAKLVDEGARFIDLEKYRITTNINERKNLVGYVGRLGRKKGIIEFVRSIPLIASAYTDIEFLIVGEGDLTDWVKEECERLSKECGIGTISIRGWIPPEDIPDILNTIKVLVLPSMGEGLPTIILESMACGAPVLATPKGAIPALVMDGSTGFLMETISPDCIALNVMRILDYRELDYIVANARALIQDNYSYDRAVFRYKKILSTVMAIE